MSTELDHDRMIELLPLYELELLEPAEMAAVAAYLQEHPELQEQQAAWEDVVLQLAQSAPAAPLPATARDRLFARVQADLDAAQPPAVAQVPPADSAGTPAAQPPIDQRPLASNPLLRPRPAYAPQPPVTPAAPPPARRFAWPASVGWLAAAASLLVAVGLLGFAVRQQARIGALGAEVEQLNAEVSVLRQQNAVLEEQWRASQNQLALYLNADRSVALGGTDLAPGAQGAFYLSDDQGVVVVSGLEPLPADQTYQLWLVPPDGTPTSVGLLPVGTGGLYTQTVSVPADLRNFAIVDVSIEQAGGSPAITKEAIVLRGVLN